MAQRQVARDARGDAWKAAGEQIAIAPVVKTCGSSPRPAGSRLVVTMSGRLEGPVSGGCIESAVADAAKDAMKSGTPRMLDFGISDERAWEMGLACGGKVRVLVAPLVRGPLPTTTPLEVRGIAALTR